MWFWLTRLCNRFMYSDTYNRNTCHKCGHITLISASYCYNCGEKVQQVKAQRCPRCYYPNMDIKVNYCHKCGAKLKEV